MADKLEGAEAQAEWLNRQGDYQSEDVAKAIRDAGMTSDRWAMLRIAERSRLDRDRADGKARRDMIHGEDRR